MSKKGIVWLASTITLLALVFILFPSENSGHDSHAVSTQADQLSQDAVVSQTPLRTDDAFSELPYQSQVSPLPESLRGARMDVPLAVDESGNLRVSGDVRMVFDYFLAAIHEEELDTILARIEEYLDYFLSEPALGQARQLLANYIALKQDLMEYEQQQGERLQQIVAAGQLQDRAVELLEAQLDARDALRAQHLGQEAHEAFYRDEELYDRYTLARMKVLRNEELSEEEKDRQLTMIDAQAPEELVASRRETQIIDELQRKERALEESGASREELEALRVEMFGVEAAERFEALDAERSAWQTRLDDYLSARRDILQNEGLTRDDQNREIDLLRRSRFDEREQIRVRVYERMADSEENSQV
ncbi:MAG: lipase secretion chaperone [Oleiphilaceae bacterium]|nr:lipase secretion chaperone [Oleiphilaceae bacterium]